MDDRRTIATFKIDTLRDLLSVLLQVAADENLVAALDASIDCDGGHTYSTARIVEKTLSDKSKVLDFELAQGWPKRKQGAA